MWRGVRWRSEVFQRWTQNDDRRLNVCCDSQSSNHRLNHTVDIILWPPWLHDQIGLLLTRFEVRSVQSDESRTRESFISEVIVNTDPVHITKTLSHVEFITEQHLHAETHTAWGGLMPFLIYGRHHDFIILSRK